jgi:hypothetical protein
VGLVEFITFPQEKNVTDKFSQPTEIDAATAAFPAGVRDLMPAYDEIRKEYDSNRKWSNRLFNDWFFTGIESHDGLVPKEGVDKTKALRHIRAVMGSWEPKHEHKEAAVAYLLSLWFDDVKYEAAS